MMSMCFIPHHRVAALDSAGHRFVFRVCFACDEVNVQEEMPFMTPPLWQSSLRRLFTDHKVQIRGAKEYFRLYERAHPNRQAGPTGRASGRRLSPSSIPTAN
jgi:hypothetical protein